MNPPKLASNPKELEEPSTNPLVWNKPPQKNATAQDSHRNTCPNPPSCSDRRGRTRLGQGLAGALGRNRQLRLGEHQEPAPLLRARANTVACRAFPGGARLEKVHQGLVSCSNQKHMEKGVWRRVPHGILGFLDLHPYAAVLGHNIYNEMCTIPYILKR